MSKTHAIIFDLDGTAVDSPVQNLPSGRLAKAVEGVRSTYALCAATGRSWSFSSQIFEFLQLEDPCIISGGTQICDPKNGNILWRCPIVKADLDAVLEIYRRYPEHKLIVNDFSEDDYLHGGIDISDFQVNEEVYFIAQKFIPEHEVAPIIEELSSIEGIVSTLVVAQRPGYKDLHVTNRAATKEHAVIELLKLLELEQDNAIGIGDGHNDIHLFAAVGEKVAMGNAVPELIEAADRVVAEVSEDGMAQYLEELAGKNR